MLLDHGPELASEEEAGNEKQKHGLFVSLRVYVMADKFDVPALKLLARHRFYDKAKGVFPTCKHFPDVVDELYESTAPNDKAMREIPSRFIFEGYFRDHPGFVINDYIPVNKHGDLATSAFLLRKYR